MTSDYQHYHDKGYTAGQNFYSSENHAISLVVLRKQASQAASSAKVPLAQQRDYSDGFMDGFRDKRRESEVQ